MPRADSSAPAAKADINFILAKAKGKAEII